MKLIIDPDNDTKQNLQFTVKLIQAKLADRYKLIEDECVLYLRGCIVDLEREIGNVIPIGDLKKELKIKGFSSLDVEQAIEKLKRRGEICEPKHNMIERI